MSTVFCGLRIAAVSAMKWTPQKTIASASVAAASRERPSESPDEVRDVLYLGHLVVVGEDHRASLGGELADLLLHGGDLVGQWVMSAPVRRRVSGRNA